ncbi:trypsin, alkaline C-like [Trichoplusia ni]|uniref:Trypsin, alkaline C-like n=1 Tax=Trichoplusia ni TaxID=7111 RepID=A0A7E5WEG1_TRINI|nr:trypsin, alkaline C-like [Trichoplusia ni]
MQVIALVVLLAAAVSAVPANPQRILGGSITSIETYPDMAALLFTWNWSHYNQNCGSVILNQRSVLTAAHCPGDDPPTRWRFRVGSTWGNNGGVVHHVTTIFVHPNFNRLTLNSDIAVMRTGSTIAFTNSVAQTSIAGTNYNLADNQNVMVVGWGALSQGGSMSPQLRHIQLRSVNQQECINRFSDRNSVINENNLCTAILDQGGLGQCSGDSGGPVYHNGVVVGLTSFVVSCGNNFYPSVNTRVSRFTPWVLSVA